MTTKISRISIILLTAILLISCASQDQIEPTATMTQATEIPKGTETPSVTFTPTVTTAPTATEIPMPVSLSGAVFLSADSDKPFVSVIELRLEDDFKLVTKAETDTSGGYLIEEIMPGNYELWVLITSNLAMIPGCNDVAPPDDMWKIGITFEGDKGLTMANAYLSKALLLSESFQGTDLAAKGFYAVSPIFEIVPGTENKMDIILFCK